MLLGWGDALVAVVADRQVRRRAGRSTALRRNSGGLAAGITDSSLEAIIASGQVSGKPGQAPIGCRRGARGVLERRRLSTASAPPIKAVASALADALASPVGETDATRV
ncbi:hypothetical protein CCE02nite_36910 [Cellulosimicrobium cellulans]|uniref:Uncharacterized protein n=1 Tax=Cellulosimicrobium cellulans TaxID=1710 RepID=A0A4Y4E265_CELCE|nr:hypothetical protein CCE02nite_36910 [Cellulosimicrobium cellulans]